MPLSKPLHLPAVSNTPYNLPPHLQQRLRQASSSSSNTESQLRRKLEQATARRAYHLSRSIHLCRLTLRRVRQRQHATQQRMRATAVRLGRRLAAADRNRARADRRKAERARVFSQRFAVGAAVWIRDFYSEYSVAAEMMTTEVSYELYRTVKRAGPSSGTDGKNGNSSADVVRASVEPQIAARTVCRALRHYAVGRVFQREFPYFLEPWAPTSASKVDNGFVSAAQNAFGPDNTLHCYETMSDFIKAPPTSLAMALNLLFLNSHYRVEEESVHAPQKTNCTAGKYPRLLLSAFLVAHNSGMLGVHPGALRQARMVGMALARLFVATPKSQCNSICSTSRNNKNGTKNNNSNDLNSNRNSSSNSNNRAGAFQGFACGDLIELEGQLIEFGRLVEQDRQIAERHVAQALVENAELTEHYHQHCDNSISKNLRVASKTSSSLIPIVSSSNKKDNRDTVESTAPKIKKSSKLFNTDLSDRTAQTVALRERIFSRFPDYTPLERFSLESDVYPALQLLPPPESAPVTEIHSDEIIDKFEIDALIRVCVFEVLLDPEFRLTPARLPAYTRFQQVYQNAGFNRAQKKKEKSMMKGRSALVQCEWFVETALTIAQLFCLIRAPTAVLAALPGEARVRQLLLANNYDYDTVLAKIYPQYIALLGSEIGNTSNDEHTAIEQFLNQLAQKVCAEWNQKLLDTKEICAHLTAKLMRTEPQRMAELVKTGKVVVGDGEELVAMLALGSNVIAPQWEGQKRERALEVLNKLYALS